MPPPLLIMTIESPILISLGAPDRTSPSASNTECRKATSPATSGVNIRGVTLCQPSGRNRFIPRPSSGQKPPRPFDRPACPLGGADAGLAQSPVRDLGGDCDAGRDGGEQFGQGE